MLFEYAHQAIPLYVIVLLSLITVLTLILPFAIKFVNDQLELFFLTMGLAAVTISGVWSWELVLDAAKAPLTVGGLPIGIFQVVLVFGLLIHYFNRRLYPPITRLFEKLSPGLFYFLLVLFLGLFSSILSVIVTAVILSEVLLVLPIKREDKIKIAVISCFSIGLGAGLTPIGEPLSTIMVYKLSGPPYNADFLFPLRTFGFYIIPGIIVLALAASILLGRKASHHHEEGEAYSENVKGIVIRAFKVYIFISALILLGDGIKPLFELFLNLVPPMALYWINLLSAFLDNATLTAIEINQTLALSQIVSAIIALLISGGILIPGNIPNIVAAARLRISMKEWAIIGVPIGLSLMVLYFIALLPIFLTK
jgi:predicted cation transporter